MKKRVFWMLLVASTMILNCKKEGQNLKGTVAGAANLQVFFEKIYFNNQSDSKGKTDADAAGKFKFEFKEPFAAGVYRLRFGAKKVNLVFDGSEKTVEITGDMATIDQYDFTISGSETSARYAGYIKKMLAEKLNANAIREMVVAEKNPLVAATLSLSMMGQAKDFLPLFRAQGEQLANHMPGSAYSNQYEENLKSVQQAIMQQQVTPPEAAKIGAVAPEISLPDPSGKTRSLSSLRGQVVLLDFWASWCGPCRKANPHVVELYKKYKSRGFTVFSVSFDGVDSRRSQGMNPDQLASLKEDGRKKWVEAIKKDGLVWEHHVSDLNHWGAAPAAVYGVNSIPRTFLIDKKGVIRGSNLGDGLEAELKKWL